MAYIIKIIIAVAIIVAATELSKKNSSFAANFAGASYCPFYFFYIYMGRI